jgi:hypothetical protein
MPVGLNTGTFIGYKNNLLGLMNDICQSIDETHFVDELKKEGWELTSKFVDQTIISHHLAKYWDKYNITLDFMCNIFYLPVQDWYNIKKYVHYKLDRRSF